LTNISVGKESEEDSVSVGSTPRTSNIRQTNDEPDSTKGSDEDDEDDDDDGYNNYYIFGIDSKLLTSIFIYISYDHKVHLR
jgi:hypothetical protein